MIALHCLLLQLGDVIDARDEEMGAWFEARIVKISPCNNKQADSEQSQQQLDCDEPTASSSTDATSMENIEADDDGFLYSIIFEQSVCQL